MTVENCVLLICVGAFTAAACCFDYWTRRIPNYLTVPSFLVAIAYQIWARGFPDGLGIAALGFATGFALLLALMLIGGGGAGDVKLMGALGAWIGWMLTFYVFVLASLIVALAAVVFFFIEWATRGWSAARRHLQSNRPSDQSSSSGKWRERRRMMPYALSAGLATWIVLAWKIVWPALS